MAVTPEIDVSPYSTLASEIRHQQQAVLDYSQRVKVSAITFIVVLLTCLSYVWLQPTVFQSSALLRFVYPEAIGADQNATIERNFSASGHSLTSQSILSLLQASLDTQGINLTTEELSTMLDNKVDINDRLMHLYAVDRTRDHIKVVMDTWLSLYLKTFENQQNHFSTKDRKLIEKKLAELKKRIQQQSILLQQFREANDIVFLEQNKNRIFNKMDTISKQLSETEIAQTELTSQLAAINQASRDGIAISNSYTETLIRKTQLLIQTLRNELDALSHRYTQKYMQKDPVIVEKSRRLTELEATLQEQLKEGAIAYKHETVMQLTKVQLKIDELLSQRQSLKGDVQSYSTQLAQYKNMTMDLQNLEQNQAIQKTRLLDISINHPFTPRIDILEPPVTPDYPIGPNYWLNSGVAFIVALLSSIFALIIFKLIAIKRPSAATTYTLVQSQSGLIEPSSTRVKERQALTHNLQPKTLSTQASLTESHIYLDEHQSKILLAHVSGESEIALMFIYSGVTPEELLKLTVDQLDIDAGMIHLIGRFQRSIVMPTSLQQTLLTANARKEITFDKLSKAIQKAARDALIENAELIDLNCIRHSYLMYLALQGVRLSELEQIAGYIPPNQLGKYKELVANDMTIDLSEINPIHPALRTTSY